MKRTLILLILATFSGYFVKSQTPVETPKSPVQFKPFDGIFVAGYVDRGAFVNFTGPNISATVKNSKFMLGMLPSLRYKEDKGTFRNAPVTPNLGMGFTYCYKQFAIQVPFYYNVKTASSNGRWTLGIGIGLRLKSR